MTVTCCLCPHYMPAFMFPMLPQTAASQLQVNVKLTCEISRMCECVKPQHTPAVTHGPPPREARLRLWPTPPACSSYKTKAPGAACWGLLTLTRGDVIASLGQTISTIYQHWSLQTPPKDQTNMAPFEKSMEMMPFKQRKCLGNNLLSI